MSNNSYEVSGMLTILDIPIEFDSLLTGKLFMLVEPPNILADYRIFIKIHKGLGQRLFTKNYSVKFDEDRLVKEVFITIEDSISRIK